MVRWEPDAAGRLRQAALDLYVDKGFDQATVAEIAERAGVTSRTFFRYFADKREVLFAGSEQLEADMVAAVTDAPSSATPLDAVAAALDAAAAKLGGNQAYSRRRQAVITANAELRERELNKMATLGDALTAALAARRTPPVEARIAAEAGIAVFRIGFERWVADEAPDDLAGLLRDSLDQLRGLAR